MSQRIVVALAALFLFGGCEVRVGGEPVTEVPGDEEEISCEDDTDCPERAICRGGLCEHVGAGCVSKTECNPFEVCLSGTCAPPTGGECLSSDECLGAGICDGFSRTCFDPNATGCQGPSDCAFEPGCEAGCVCEDSGACAPAVEEPDPDPEDPDPPPTGAAIELGGFLLENRETSPPTQVGVLPQGLALAPGQRLVIGRDAEKSAFEAFWDVSFGDDVLFLNGQAGSTGVPIINGGERWALVSPVGTVVDGTTIEGAKDRAYRRIAAGSASDAGRWQSGSPLEATPGETTLPSTGVGLVISQWSDASTYIYEFVELYYAP